MPMLFKDNMGMIHIWKKGTYDKCEPHGLHYSLTTCNKKESDVLIQNNPESWEKRHLSSKQRQDLGVGDFLKVRKLKESDYANWTDDI